MKIIFKLWVKKHFKKIFNHQKGVNFMEQTIKVQNNEITFMIWDLGGL